MTKLGRIAVTVLASIGLVVALAACGKAGSSQGSASSSGTGPTTTAAAIPAKAESGTFQMGIEPWLGYGPWQVAKQKGFFTANGINVNVSNFTTDDQINAALASGKLDGANIATHTMLRWPRPACRSRPYCWRTRARRPTRCSPAPGSIRSRI